jgi:hypothetical protein
MPVTVKVDPIDRDIAVILRDDLSPAAQSATLAEFARASLLEGEEQNLAVLGHVPPHDTIVDGREGAQPESVRPNGVIVFEFNLLGDLFAWIGEQLVLHSPVKSGRYARSFAFYADGQEISESAPPPPAAEYVFLNRTPYSRKIERGESPQAPDGVFHAVAVLAARRFGNIARISFAYRTPIDSIGGGGSGRSDGRTPAIVITLRR